MTIKYKYLITSILIIIATVNFSGCAQYGGYRPTVDTYTDPNAYNLNQDTAACRQLAEQASGGGVTSTLVDAGVGALIGAAGGAVVGAFTGNPGAGAGIGAAAGGFGGGAYGGLDSNEKFKSAYRNCMRNRGHNVVN